MKSLAIWLLLLWFAVVLEFTRPDFFASCSIVLPVATSCVLWHRNSVGLVLATSALLLRWLLAGHVFPAEITVLLVGTYLLLTRTLRDPAHGVMAHQSNGIRFWGMSLLVVTLSVLAHTGTLRPLDLLEAVKWRLLVAVPLTTGLLLFMRAGDELGLRRSH